MGKMMDSLAHHSAFFSESDKEPALERQPLGWTRYEQKFTLPSRRLSRPLEIKFSLLLVVPTKLPILPGEGHIITR
jgi:hypothetical protein